MAQPNTAHKNVFDEYTKVPPPPGKSIVVTLIEHGTRPGELARCDIKIGGIFVTGVRITNKGRGVFINFPARKVGERWIDIVKIVSPALRVAVEDAIMAALAGLGGAK